MLLVVKSIVGTAGLSYHETNTSVRGHPPNASNGAMMVEHPQRRIRSELVGGMMLLRKSGGIKVETVNRGVAQRRHGLTILGGTSGRRDKTRIGASPTSPQDPPGSSPTWHKGDQRGIGN